VVWLVVVVPSDQCLDPGIAPKKKKKPSLACGCGAFPAGYGAVRFGPYRHGSEYGVFLGRGCTVSQLQCRGAVLAPPVEFFFIATHLELPWYNFIIHK